VHRVEFYTHTVVFNNIGNPGLEGTDERGQRKNFRWQMTSGIALIRSVFFLGNVLNLLIDDVSQPHHPQTISLARSNGSYPIRLT